MLRTKLTYFVQCRFTSTEIVLTIRDEEPRTSTSTFTQPRTLSTCPLFFRDYLLFVLSWCFTSTETVWLIRDGEKGASGTRPVKTEETVSHRRNYNVMEVGTPPMRSNLCTPLTAVSTAVRSEVTKDGVRKAAVEEQLSSKTVTVCLAVRAQLQLPDLLISPGF